MFQDLQVATILKISFHDYTDDDVINYFSITNEFSAAVLFNFLKLVSLKYF